MATEKVVYLSYPEAVLVHIELMRHWGELRYGVSDRTLVESALARPQQAAAYGGADLPAQAATLLYGLIKNHPWAGGNKRTATALTQLFLRRNGFRIVVAADDLLELVYAVEADEWQIDEIESWLRQHVAPKVAEGEREQPQ
ncbi:MAG: type II toxin-antitoxin system death-on-curing family toxin [Acidobacteriota bacterium]|nr:type II toxin-antitoxin system death-on-curing family toxin [Acidobacteriota bacterium]